MSDPRSGVPAHQTHDELLVARLAGGDTLDTREHANASALVSSCPDCAVLASDIAAISRAVASESVPLRRRDFRISPEEAAELRGSPLRRLLRRLTLPSGGGALKPLASGALSIGLVLVFVGSVVPRPQVESTALPRAVSSEDDGLRASDAFAAATPSAKAGTEESDTMGEEPPAADDPGVDGLAEMGDTMALEAATGAAPEESAGPASPPEVAADAAPEAAAQTVERARLAPTPPSIAMMEGDAEAAPDERVDVAADVPPDPTLDDGNAAIVTEPSGTDVGLILVATGVALVGVGIVLVLLLLLSRRRPGTLNP